MWQITLETGYYPGARHTPRGIYLVMIAFRSGKVGDTPGVYPGFYNDTPKTNCLQFSYA